MNRRRLEKHRKLSRRERGVYVPPSCGVVVRMFETSRHFLVWQLAHGITPDDLEGLGEVPQAVVAEAAAKWRKIRNERKRERRAAR